jgi:hypothetical protein
MTTMASGFKMKWWHWTMLISGSAMVIGGIVSIIIL